MKKEIAIRRGLVLFLACLLTVGLLPQPARARVPDWQVSLLHPEEFFGEAEDIFYDSRDEETVYLFTVRKDPKEDLEDFADDLLKAEGICDDAGCCHCFAQCAKAGQLRGNPPGSFTGNATGDSHD